MFAEEAEGRELAMAAIEESVRDSVIPIIRRFRDPCECWHHLKDRYESHSGSRRLMLLRKLVYSKKPETTSMEQYLKDVKDTVDQLDEIKVPIQEDLVGLLLLHSLPREYKEFTRSQTGKTPFPSFAELESRLLDEELQMTLDAEKEGSAEALMFRKRSPFTKQPKKPLSLRPPNRREPAPNRHEPANRPPPHRDPPSHTRNTRSRPPVSKTCNFCDDTDH